MEFNLARHIEQEDQTFAASNHWNRSQILAVAISALIDANYRDTAEHLTAMLDPEFAKECGLV
jgi:hypothetical protein